MLEVSVKSHPGKKVLVTGAAGHLGLSVVQELVARNYHVRASVRDITEAKKLRYLADLPIELVQANILNVQEIENAVEGMDGVFHVAAAYKTWAKNPDEEIRAPALQGTINVLNACHKHGVKKVIYTSSVAAVGFGGSLVNPLTEDAWNTLPLSPYVTAKVDAERLAWEMAEKFGLNMISLLPSAMIGPNFHRHTPTTQMFEKLLRGKIKSSLPVALNFIDVRDVALAHVLAYENGAAKGRYICSDMTYRMQELVNIIKNDHPKLKLPTREIPIPVLSAVVWAESVRSCITGKEPLLIKTFVKEYCGKGTSRLYSSEKLTRDLGWKPAHSTNTLADTLEWTKKNFIRETADRSIQ